jgi:hypothetical protein
MKNCLIMGFGRSGTSMIGGILHTAGYFMGHDLFPPHRSNPLGYFENDTINAINENILKKYDYSALNTYYPKFQEPFTSFNPTYGQRWLSYISPETEITNSDPSIAESIQQVTSEPVFAYKDPRFNYTLHIWNKYLRNDTVFICMFRQPEITVESILTDCKHADYLRKFYINSSIAYTVWQNSYNHLLKILTPEMMKRTAFIHYQQILKRQKLDYLSQILEVKLDYSFVSDNLDRSRSQEYVPSEVREVYQKLCTLAGYNE